MKQYRYPGAQPFSSAQEHIFFGREQDMEALYRLIRLEPLVVLHSKSGMGKSSLLNAGIVPQVLKDAKYQPIPIRFNAYNSQNEALQLPLEATIEAIKAAFRNKSQTSFLEKLLPPEESLWYLLKRHQAQHGNKQQLLLLFDQFEELFTYPDAAVLAFKEQIADVLHTQIPQRLRNIVEREVEKPTHLSPEQLALLHQPLEARMVFAIRSDRISLLDKIADYLPLVKRNWYELDALRLEQAEDAILNPAYKKGAFISPVFDYDDEAIEKILGFLTKGNAQKIESFQLQILCQAIERKVLQQNLKVVHTTAIGDIAEVYENYYENQIRLIQDPGEQTAARRFIEEGLIFEEEERRLSLYEGQIYRQFGISEPLLRKLEDTHLIRRESSMKGDYTYELSHDTLVAPVLKAKMVRLNAEKEREKTRKDREREQQLLQERKKRKWAVALAAAGVLLAVFATVASLFAVKAQQQAQQNEKEAALQKNKAELALLETENAQKTTLSALDSVNLLRGRAQQLLLIAELSENAAISEKQNAQKQANRAVANYYLFKANELVEKDRDLGKARAVLQEAARIDPDNAAISDAFLAISPSVQLPRPHHDGPILKAAFNRAGNRIITASSDHTVKIWDRAGRRKAVLRAHTGAVTDFQVAPADAFILSGDERGLAVLWRPTEDKSILLQRHNRAIRAVAISPDGRFVATASADSTAVLWTAEGKIVAVLKGHTGELNSVAFSPDGTMLLTASADKTARRWNRAGEVLQAYVHKSSVNTAVFSPDGTRVLTGSGDQYFANSDNRAILWNADGSVLAEMDEQNHPVQHAIFSKDGSKILVNGLDNYAYLYDTTGKRLSRFRHDSSIGSAVFSPDGDAVLTASDDHTALLFNLDGGSRWSNNVSILHNGPVYGAAFSPDGNYIVTASGDRNFGLWDLYAKPQPLNEGHLGKLRASCLSPDGNQLATAGWDGKLLIWDVRTGAIQKNVRAEGGSIAQMQASRKSQFFCTVSPDGVARLWNWEGQALQQLKITGDSLKTMALSPDGTFIAGATAKGVILLWKNNAYGAPLRRWQGHDGAIASLAFSADGSQLLSAGQDRYLRIWDAGTGKLRQEILEKEPVQQAGFITGVGRVAYLTGIGGIKIWNVEKNSTELFTLPSGSRIVRLAVHPRGRFLALGEASGTVSLYTPEGKLLATLRGGLSLEQLALDAGGDVLTAAFADGSARMWLLNVLAPYPGLVDLSIPALSEADRKGLLLKN